MVLEFTQSALSETESRYVRGIASAFNQRREMLRQFLKDCRQIVVPKGFCTHQEQFGEMLSHVEASISNYVLDARRMRLRPLNILISAPPGAGKTTLIKQLTHGDPDFEFNMSSVLDIQSMADFFDRIKERTEERKIPSICLFDEIDSPQINFFQLMLWPMSDGRFLHHGRKVEIGPAIFFFAMSSALGNEARGPEDLSYETWLQYMEKTAKDWMTSEYSTGKTKDFLSRIDYWLRIPPLRHHFCNCGAFAAPHYCSVGVQTARFRYADATHQLRSARNLPEMMDRVVALKSAIPLVLDVFNIARQTSPHRQAVDHVFPLLKSICDDAHESTERAVHSRASSLDDSDALCNHLRYLSEIAVSVFYNRIVEEEITEYANRLETAVTIALESAMEKSGEINAPLYWQEADLLKILALMLRKKLTARADSDGKAYVDPRILLYLAGSFADSKRDIDKVVFLSKTSNSAMKWQELPHHLLVHRAMPTLTQWYKFCEEQEFEHMIELLAVPTESSTAEKAYEIFLTTGRTDAAENWHTARNFLISRLY